MAAVIRLRLGLASSVDRQYLVSYLERLRAKMDSQGPDCETQWLCDSDRTEFELLVRAGAPVSMLRPYYI
jgi:hypothetical protein